MNAPETAPAATASCPVDHHAAGPPRWEERAGRLAGKPGSARVGWLLSYGITRVVLGAGSRRGQLIARMETDPALRVDPFPGYEELRRQGPIARGGPFVATASHSAATAVLRNNTFGVAEGRAQLPPFVRRVLDRIVDPEVRGPVDPPSLLAVDPPLHSRYRRLVTKAFSAKSIAGREEQIQQVADRLLDRMASTGRGPVDVIDRYTALLPVAVISEILGVPEHMQSQVLAWGNDAAVSLDPSLSWCQYRTVMTSLRGLNRWFGEHLETLRHSPGDDLLSHLVQLDGADRLSEAELRATGLLILGAGFETTVNLMGNAVMLFAQHPEQLELLRADPAGWDNAVDEVLRHDSPVQVTVRQAYADTEVEGVELSAGQGIVVMLGGANRDPAVFDDPNAFDVRRTNADEHLAFSSGAHYCLGAGLAKLEASVGLRALYERFPDLEVAGDPVRKSTRVLRGWEHLPVALG